MTKNLEELTKDWKEGKLKQGWYFTSTAKGEVCPNLWFDDEWNDFMGMVEEVLAPCDYDEYKAMQEHISYLEKCISIYEQKEQLHTNDSIEYNKLEKENNNLRSLLKECDGCVRCLRAYGVADCNGSNINDLITKIEEIAQKALNNESEE